MNVQLEMNEQSKWNCIKWNEYFMQNPDDEWKLSFYRALTK